MGINGQELLTVKEWIKKANLDVYDYTGFIEIYAKLSYDSLGKIKDYSEVRYREAGNLVCTRQGFESHIVDCAMTIPTFAELKNMIDVLPDYVEFEIRITLSLICNNIKSGKIDPLNGLKKIYELLKLYSLAIEESIMLNNINSKQLISDLNDEEFKDKEQYKTIENLESELIVDLLSKIELLIINECKKVDDIPFDDISYLIKIAKYSKRYKSMKESGEQFIFLKLSDVKPDSFVKTVNTVDKEGTKSNITATEETYYLSEADSSR